MLVNVGIIIKKTPPVFIDFFVYSCAVCCATPMFIGGQRQNRTADPLFFRQGIKQNIIFSYINNLNFLIFINIYIDEKGFFIHSLFYKLLR